MPYELYRQGNITRTGRLYHAEFKVIKGLGKALIDFKTATGSGNICMCKPEDIVVVNTKTETFKFIPRLIPRSRKSRIF